VHTVRFNDDNSASNHSSLANDYDDDDDFMPMAGNDDTDDNNNEGNVLDVSMVDDANVSTEHLDIIGDMDEYSWGLEEYYSAAKAAQDDPSYWQLHQFYRYVEDVGKNHRQFSKNEIAAIKLMHLLRRKGSTLDTYDEVMKWHLAENGDHTGLNFINRKKLLRYLRRRYNVPKDYLQERIILLPSSGAKVNLCYHDARILVTQLLTDPRFGDNDWLHFDNDPLAAPPNDLKYLADINTGMSYRETYKRLITNPNKQMLVPILFYIDGAVTGQFDKLQVEALKMTLGILNRKAREKEYAWKVVGTFLVASDNFNRS
jgi:DNA-binding transcriptional MerR regulator